MATTNMKDLAVKSGPVVKQDSLANFIRAKIAKTLTGARGRSL